MTWFDVDKAGLAAQLERRGKAFVVFELIQNGWDAGATEVRVSLAPVQGSPFATLTVEDDSPEGFVNLETAYTMFAPSSRASDPTKRGRFNLGEKTVLALCRSAKIITTTGTLTFDGNGRRRSQARREFGTLFQGEIRMTRAELTEIEDAMAGLIPPVKTVFNGTVLQPPTVMATIKDVRLATELAGDDGIIRRSTRKADLVIYDGGGKGEILELGIPVVEADIGFRVNVMQKVPLNTDRDNVPPAFVQAVRVAVVNTMADLIEDATEPWVAEAVSDARITKDAFQAVQTKRYGERAVAAVPGDPIANARAEAAGFSVIHGGSMNSGAWANARKFESLPSSSKVFPTEKPEQVAAQAETTCPLCGK